MSLQADLTMLEPERRFFAREILGIVEAVSALLLFLALISFRRDEQWIGSMGAVGAGALIFFVGRYVAFVFPFMLAMLAWNALTRDGPLFQFFRSSIRGLGGVMLVISACALITLHAGAQTAAGVLPGRAFESGGLIGTLLIDPKGLDLTSHLGRTGAYVTFYGLATAGVVLFTETMLRDLSRILIAFALNPFPRRWMDWAPRLNEALRRALPWLRLDPVRIYMRGVHFQRDSPVRVMAPNPIAEIMSVGTEKDASVEEPDDETDESEEEKPRLRSAAKRARRRSRDPNAEPIACEQLPGGVGVLERAKSIQPELDLFPDRYELPPRHLLTDPPETNYHMSQAESDRLSRRIEDSLMQFKISVEVTEVVQGPVVTRFALHVAPGIKVSQILNLENDLAMVLKAQQVRILAPIPGQAAVGIEVPNKRTNPVMLKELLDSKELKRSKAPLSFALGKSISGEPVIADLAQMPHVLIAGATGSGKSVCLNCIIASLLFRNHPDSVKMIMIDPKRVELSVYQSIPHLLTPVVCEPRKASAALRWAIELMEKRYERMAEVGVRNIDGYNTLVKEARPRKKTRGRELKWMPRIVVVIDELADLMVVAKNEVEEFIIRLAQMARAVGIHLIIATQRPSVNVITGIIKANFPTRIAFRVSSKVDSRTILDMNGAQSLLGRGDMLYSPGSVKPFRIQGAFISDAEVESLADFIRAQRPPRYEKEDFEKAPSPARRAKERLMKSALGKGENDAAANGDGTGARASDPPVKGRTGAAPLPPASMENLTDEDLYDIALRLVLESRKASVSYIQRRLKIGYARAGRLMDMMEDSGIVGPYQGSKPRDLLVDPSQLLERLKDVEDH